MNSRQKDDEVTLDLAQDVLVNTGNRAGKREIFSASPSYPPFADPDSRVPGGVVLEAAVVPVAHQKGCTVTSAGSSVVVPSANAHIW